MPQPTVLVTGCSHGGIGSALAHEFASRGYHVFASVRDRAKAAHFADHPSIEVITLDVTAPESIERAAAEIKGRLPEGKLDILVNNAGFGATGPLIEADLATAKTLYDVNVLGVLAVTQAFVPMLVEAKGKVVNVSSTGGLVAMPWGGEKFLDFESHSYSFSCCLSLWSNSMRTYGDLELREGVLGLGKDSADPSAPNRSIWLLQSRRNHSQRNTSS